MGPDGAAQMLACRSAQLAAMTSVSACSSPMRIVLLQMPATPPSASRVLPDDLDVLPRGGHHGRKLVGRAGKYRRAEIRETAGEASPAAQPGVRNRRWPG